MKIFYTAMVAQMFLVGPLSASEPSRQLACSYAAGDAVGAVFLFVAGAWLAHKQLPRLAGQQVEYDALVFTKVFASVLFIIGVTGGTVGAYRLWEMVYGRLNHSKLSERWFSGDQG